MKAIIVPNLSILCQAIDLESSVSVRSSELSSRASYSTTVLYQPDIFINKRAESRVLSKTLTIFLNIKTFKIASKVPSAPFTIPSFLEQTRSLKFKAPSTIMRLLFKTRSFLKRFLSNDHTEMTENVNEKENFEKGLKLETFQKSSFSMSTIFPVDG